MNPKNTNFRNRSFKLPTPAVLAVIAAPLHAKPENDPVKSIKAALRLYVHASIACNEHSRNGIEEIIDGLDAPELHKWLVHECLRGERLRLYPDSAKIDSETKRELFSSGLDPARTYLSGKLGYGGWKNTRTVLHNIQLFHRERAARHNHVNATAIKELQRAHEKLAKASGTNVETHRNGMEIPMTQLRRDGRKESEAFLQEHAVFALGKRKGPDLIRNAEQKLLYWDLPTSFLDELIQFRTQVKTGSLDTEWLTPHKGIKAMERALDKMETRAAKRTKKQ